MSHADLTKKLLGWNKTLTIKQDQNGSTPLHFAASVQNEKYGRNVCSCLLKANPAALYQQDQNGSFPTHVAASFGATRVIIDFLNMSPNCAGLRDAKGRTFLHVAVEKNKTGTVYRACRNRSLSWILNMQDNNGNTALHLAVEAGGLTVVCILLANKQVELDLTNEKGETPLDIAVYNVNKRLARSSQVIYM
jgi:ankyrin repeat protein